jgi:prepilin-type N-terminal cleavage/methylation domain-containing protein
MMPCAPLRRSQNGFTLIEIIVTLMLVGITAAILFPVMGNNLIKSPEPILRLDKQYRLVEEMDKLTASYRDEIAEDGSDFSITAFKTSFVDPIVNNPAAYPNIDEASTQFIEDDDQDGTYTNSAGTTSILMVALKSGDQTLYAIFSE